MKRITGQLNQQDAILIVALTFVVVGSIFSMLHAFAGGSGIEALITPIFVSVS